MIVDSISKEDMYLLSFVSIASVFCSFSLNKEYVEPDLLMSMQNEISKKNNMIHTLQSKLKEINDNLNNENYLTALIGLSFEGFNYEENVDKIVNTIKNSAKAIFTAYYDFDDKTRTFNLKQYISYILILK